MPSPFNVRQLGPAIGAEVLDLNLADVFLPETLEAIGFKVLHLYGLTETYGPATVCEWQPQFDELDDAAQGDVLRRQGVRYPVLEAVTVRNPDTLQEVIADGRSVGEVMFRGNIVMKGYLKKHLFTL